MERYKKFLQRHLISIFLVFSDTVGLVVAFFSAYYFRNFGILKNYLDSIQPLVVYLQALPFAILILIIIFFSFGLYRPQKRLTRIGETYAVIKAISIWSLFIMAGSYLVKYDYSRLIVLSLWFFGLFFLIINRVFFRVIQKKLNKQNIGIVNILIVGCGKPAKIIANQLKRYNNLGFRIIGHISTSNDYQNDNLKIIGNINDLFVCIDKYNIDKVFIADPCLSYEKTLDLVHDCKNKYVEFSIASNVFSLISELNGLYNLDELPVLDLKKVYPNIFYRISKRLIDIFFSFVGIILTLPLWLVIMILIKKDSNGPALFTQDRVGKDGKIFKMYKFRTMSNPKMTNEKAPTNSDDHRITNIGKKLRKTSLDELPQLINILKGEMSIVGPRPEMPFIVETYNSWQRKRLLVKPGLTGLWQILGRKDLPLHENLEYDFYYINNQSLLLDMTIILKTIPMIIGGQGAY